MDETVERNLDYLVAVNTLTAYLLINLGKPTEALEFAQIAERIIFRIVEGSHSETPSPTIKLEINQPAEERAEDPTLRLNNTTPDD